MSLDNVTYARPYAKAAFELALECKDLDHWSVLLQATSQTCLDPRVSVLLDNPLVQAAQLVDLFEAVCGKAIDQQFKNFLNVLADNKRLNLLADIHGLFEKYRADHDKTLTVSVSTFMPLTPTEKDRLAQALEIRLRRSINLEVEVDKDLLGGVLVRAGDLVIDGSGKAQLEKMVREIG